MPNQNEESRTPRTDADYVYSLTERIRFLNTHLQEANNELEQWRTNRIQHRHTIAELAAATAENDRAKKCISLLLEHAGGYQTPNHIEGWDKAVALANEILNTTKSKDNNEK